MRALRVEEYVSTETHLLYGKLPEDVKRHPYYCVSFTVYECAIPLLRQTVSVLAIVTPICILQKSQYVHNRQSHELQYSVYLKIVTVRTLEVRVSSCGFLAVRP